MWTELAVLLHRGSGEWDVGNDQSSFDSVVELGLCTDSDGGEEGA